MATLDESTILKAISNAENAIRDGHSTPDIHYHVKKPFLRAHITTDTMNYYVGKVIELVMCDATTSEKTQLINQYINSARYYKKVSIK